MLLGIISLFPNMFQAVTNYGVIGKSIQKRICSIKIWNPRDFTDNRYKSVDDRPYGGGAGMLMTVKPLKKAICKAKSEFGNDSKVIYLSPQGTKLKQDIIHQLIIKNRSLILVCGRYQGVDERLIEMEVDEEWSIGDYILSGGELAAMVCIDVIVRMLPCALHNESSKESDSFFNNRLTYPQYTRPKNFDGIEVPKILLSGDHNKIHRWRVKQSIGYTWMKRPDLLIKYPLSKEENILLKEFKSEFFLKNKSKVK